MNFGLFYALQTVIGKKFMQDYCCLSELRAGWLFSATGATAAVSGLVMATASRIAGNRRRIFCRIAGVSCVTAYGAIFLSLCFDVRSGAGLKELSTMTKKEIEEKKQETKKAGLINSLIAYVNTSDVDLYNTYCRWINTIVESKNKKYLTKGIVLEAQEKINAATLLQDGRHDLNMAIDIIEIATSFEFTNMEWAINKYRSKTSNFGNFMKQPTVLKSADSNQPWLDGSTIR